jgi:hypothetical protein
MFPHATAVLYQARLARKAARTMMQFFLGKRHDCDLALLLSNGKKFFFFPLFLAEGYPCQLCLFPK